MKIQNWIEREKEKALYNNMESVNIRQKKGRKIHDNEVARRGGRIQWDMPRKRKR